MSDTRGEEGFELPPIDASSLQQFLETPIPDPTRQRPLADSGPSSAEPCTSPFPAITRNTTITIAGIPTVVTVVIFSDRMMVTISQNGKLSHWVRPMNTTELA